MIGGKVKRKSPIKKKIKRKSSQKNLKKNNVKRKSSPKKEKKPAEWTKWSEVAPQTKAQRQQLIQICGSTCFLMPNELKFPVCTPDCKVSCKGLIAARVRARQWNYPEVYKNANC